MSATLLLIEDDFTLSNTLREMLNYKGFAVEQAHDAKTGLDKVSDLKPDVIILDIMLPDMSGWEACGRLREISSAPVIMLTALGSNEHIVKGLELGADDYIVKPVAVDELAARIRAALRRVTRSNDDGNGHKRKKVFKNDYLIVDLDKREVTVDGMRVNLSPTEFRLLSVLARNKGRMLSHEYLLTQVWGTEYTNEVDYLRLYISYLRRKIEKAFSKPSLIHNEWGVGYRFG